MAALHERLVQLRKAAGLSQQELARRLQLTRSAISMYETGQREPGLETLDAMADLCQVDMNTLTGHGSAPLPGLSAKDQRDIAHQLDSLLGQLAGGEGALMFDGEPLDDETRQLLRQSLQSQLEMTKRLAKQKYTPKKYRKE